MNEHDQVKRMLDQLKHEANPALPTTAVHSIILPELSWTSLDQQDCFVSKATK